MTTFYEQDGQFVNVKKNIAQHVNQYKNWYKFQGIVFIIAGILAIILPSATAIGFSFLIGALLIISGFIQAVACFRTKSHWWSTISALLSLIIGLLMIFNPVAGTVALATILAVFLLLEGIIEIILSFQFRSVKNWDWLLLSGLVSLILAYIVFSGWPGASLILLGIIIGINLLLYGIALFVIARSTVTH
ncbi:DUF308 domain-containing protein [Rickettsiales bacterium]|nr:DUF308 domain-containing protein [Rickettsiales bacterium]